MSEDVSCATCGRQIPIANFDLHTLRCKSDGRAPKATESSVDIGGASLTAPVQAIFMRGGLLKGKIPSSYEELVRRHTKLD